MTKNILSVVVPCRNEEANLKKFLENLILELDKNFLNSYEVIVVDNQSSDNSFEISKALEQVITIKELEIGYGSALSAGIRIARGEYVVVIDADFTYLPSDIFKMYNELKAKDLDLVYGNRIEGNIESGAMPVLHELFGTPFLNFIFNFLFSSKIKDINSGLRIFKRDVFNKQKFNEKGMSFASEFFIKFVQSNFKIGDVPITYQKSPNFRKSNLKTFQDGFAHLKIILMSKLYKFRS